MIERLYLFTTYIKSDDSGKLKRLVDSLRVYEDCANISLNHIVLLQNVSVGDIEQLRENINFPSFTTILNVPVIVSLSSARNIMLKYTRDNVPEFILPGSIVGFPDDDCWFPCGLIENISKTMFLENLEFLFFKYGNSPEKFSERGCLIPARYQDVVLNVCSITMFLKSELVNQLGGFNELLGVGAKYNGGEDLNYGLKAFFVSKSSAWFDSKLIGHADKPSGNRGKYYLGSALSLKKFALTSPAAFFIFIRKLVIGVVLVTTFKMQFKKLVLLMRVGSSDV